IGYHSHRYGVDTGGHHDRHFVGSTLHLPRKSCRANDDYIDLAANEVVRNRRHALNDFPFCSPTFQEKVLTLHIAKITQCLNEHLCKGPLSQPRYWAVSEDQAHSIDPGGRLCPCRKRTKKTRAADQHDEFPAHHSMTHRKQARISEGMDCSELNGKRPEVRESWLQLDRAMGAQ